jgi:hypothetical protein
LVFKGFKPNGEDHFIPKPMNYLNRNKKRLSRIVIYSAFSLSTAYCTLNDEDLYEGFVGDVQERLFEADSSSFNFIVISDWGFNGSNNQLLVAAEMEQVSEIAGIQCILTSGDNFQLMGVKSTEDYLWSTNYENVYNDSSLSVPWYPALGNHDYMGNPEAQVQYSNINTQWNMPSCYYTFVKSIDANASIRFIVLDTPGLINAYEDLEDPSNFENITQYKWLKELLPQVKEKWVIVTGHHPVFSASTYHGDTKEMNIMIKPLLNEFKVDYICGHDHHFEHAKEDNMYTDYIVTGTGGEVRPVGINFRTVFSMTSLGFTYMSLSDNLSKLFFITADGKVAYQYEKMKI